MESYIGEKYLLDEEDILLFKKLTDKYAMQNLNGIIKACHDRLKSILDDPNDLFQAQVYFKLKNIKIKENGQKEYNFRPIHTADLTDQICMVCLLHALLYKYKRDKKELSELALIMPHNFFGNLVSLKMEELYQPWPVAYKRYNETIEKKAKEYMDTLEYQSQICLDLVNFFPSINPCFIYEYACDRLASTFDTEEDKKTLNKILSKLLFMKISSTDFAPWKNDYYKGINNSKHETSYYTRGIAQGLPQAMFFGNLCMIEVAKTIESVFPGDSYYYVDDSVIFSKESINEESFKKRIGDVNNILSNRFDVKRDNHDLFIPEDCRTFIQRIQDKIQCHGGDEGKSFIVPLLNDEGKPYIWQFPIFTREVSIAGSLSDNLEEIDDIQSEKKLLVLIEALDKIIANLDGKDIKKSGQVKFLKRYRKYFEFRKMLLHFRNTENALDFYKEEFEDKFFIENKASIKKIKILAKNLDEGIFRAQYRYLVGQSGILDNKVQDIVSKLERFVLQQKGISANNPMTYYKKDLEGSIFFREQSHHTYDSLIKTATKYVSSKKGTIRTEKLKDLLENKAQILTNFNWLSKEQKKEQPCFYMVAGNSEEFWRKIFNAIVSLYFHCDVNDNLVFLKNSPKKITFCEFRILAYIRNKQFSVASFMQFLNDLETNKTCNQVNSIGADLSLLNVVEIFIHHVKNPIHIDNLLVTHAIVKGLWMNGSKFLYSYTLHNEEHAIELIRLSIRIIRKIDCLSLKQEDFYILFIACYLHDISMVIQPNIASFVKKKTETDVLATTWLIDLNKKDFSSNALSSTKEMMVEAFQVVYSYFESSVRSRHPQESASYMKSCAKTLFSYLESNLLQNVSEVAESHGWNASEIYGRKSRAKDNIISMKYMMILIRLADLLDMSKERVNYFLLKENLKNLPLTSCFHWISHYITDKVEITADYKYNDAAEFPIHEIVIVNIYLNINYNITALKKPHVSCKYWQGAFCHGKQQDKDSLGVDRNQYDRIKNSISENNCQECKLLCKWMHYKNEWLFPELVELEHYINQINSSLFHSSIEVNIIYGKDKRLDQDLFDKVIKYLGE